LRTRLFAVLIALLVLAGYGHQIYAHAMPSHADSAEHQHSDAEETSGCHHCTCHCSPVMLASLERTITFQVPTFVGYIAARGEIAPESIPLGIDHPPQLA